MHRFALSGTKRRDRLGFVHRLPGKSPQNRRFRRGFVHRLGIETPKQADASRIHAPKPLGLMHRKILVLLQNQGVKVNLAHLILFYSLFII